MVLLGRALGPRQRGMQAQGHPRRVSRALCVFHFISYLFSLSLPRLLIGCHVVPLKYPLARFRQPPGLSMIQPSGLERSHSTPPTCPSLRALNRI
jgi:hypothetical protein